MNEPKLRFKDNNGNQYPKWEEKKLKEVAARITRKNKDNSTDIPLTISSLDGLIDQRDFFNKVVASKNMSGYYLLKKGEFAYNKSYSKGYDFGSIKRLNLYDKGALSTLYICFALKDNENSDFYEKYFDSLSWYSELQKICTEGARNHGLLNVSTDDFFEFKLHVPVSKEEQQKIASLFTELDDLIQSAEKELEGYRELKQGMLQKMFPKNGETTPEIRFPEFTGDWEQRKVGEFLTESRKSGHKGDVAHKLTVKLWGKGVYEKNEVGSVNTQYFTRHAGQFIYSKLDFLNCAFGVVPEELESFETTADLPAFDCDGVNPHFMFYTAIQPSFYEKNGMIADGSRKAKRIHVDTFLDMPFFVPSLEEQNKIVSLLSGLDDLLTLQQKELDGYKELKKGLLQQMFC